MDAQNKKILVLACSTVLVITMGSMLFFLFPYVRAVIGRDAPAESRADSRDSILKEGADQKNTARKAAKKNAPDKATLQKINLKILRDRAILFRLEKGRYPDRSEAVRVLSPAPLEPVSGRSGISLEKNNRGGWFYSPDTGNVEVNL